MLLRTTEEYDRAGYKPLVQGVAAFEQLGDSMSHGREGLALTSSYPPVPEDCRQCGDRARVRDC
jgi:hypothetical protein